MKIYIAAPYPVRDDAIKAMLILEAAGHEVTSGWLRAPNELGDEWARKDLEDVAAAEVLLALNATEWENAGTGGRHVELGYALALNKRVVLIGNRSNIFHYLNMVHVVDHINEALLWLK